MHLFARSSPPFSGEEGAHAYSAEHLGEQALTDFHTLADGGMVMRVRSEFPAATARGGIRTRARRELLFLAVHLMRAASESAATLLKIRSLLLHHTRKVSTEGRNRLEV